MFHKAIINKITVFIKIKWMLKIIPLFRFIYSNKPANVYIMLRMIIGTVVHTITFTIILS
ncbi:hypothetical protein N037_09755 [Enterobacter sp. EGD-HP1]|nr:hypothetical protein N037_09755 [Enterobacter sp. EGD-HP1]